MTRIYSYTLKLSALLLRGRGGASFRGRWIISVTILLKVTSNNVVILLEIANALLLTIRILLLIMLLYNT